eukprot:gene18243-28115_t
MPLVYRTPPRGSQWRPVAYPALSDEEAYLMWVNRKMMAGELKAESVLPYATCFRMSRVDRMGAYRCSVKPAMEQFVVDVHPGFRPFVYRQRVLGLRRALPSC